MQVHHYNFQFKILIIFLLLSLAIGAWLMKGSREKQETGLDSFAKCLTERGIVMYGAYWCPHCQNQRKSFGESFRFVTYVECAKETQKCLQNKIEEYPTWIFPDGKRFRGEQSIEKLARESGCSLPEPKERSKN